MLQRDHLCWQQIVNHEKRDAKMYKERHMDSIDNLQSASLGLEQVQSVRVKNEFYRKHPERFLAEI